LIGAGLLVRSAILMQRVDPGFDPHNLLVAGIELPAARYPTDSARTQQFDAIARAVAALPGVASVTLVSRIPIASWGSDCNFRVEGSPEHGQSYNANARVATTGYFETLRIPLRVGRSFTSADRSSSGPVAVINHRLERKLFGNASGLGRRIACGSNPHWLTVVGITGDLHARGLGEEVRDEVYVPLAQSPRSSMAVIVRGSVPVTSLAGSMRRAIAAVDPLLPLSGLRTMDEIIDRTLAAPRFTSELLSLLGALGLALAVIGIYGVIAYFVAQRTNEIGIRMALGADAGRVVRMVVRQGLTLALLGIVIGSVASYFLAATLDSMLYGITSRDPVTFAFVVVLLATVAVLASLIPARRAASVDPLEALRAN
jgi:putative ABC transport system permease protein